MYWQTLIRIFDALSLRERGLIAVTLLCLVWGLWAISLEQYVTHTKVEVTSNIEELAQQLSARTNVQQQVVKAWPSRLDLMSERSDARASLAAVSEQIDLFLNRAMDPQEVSDLLHAMLARYPGIELVSLKNLPAQEIVVDEQASGLFRHPIQLVIHGGYEEVVHYVEALEDLSAGVLFRRLDYQVESYPLARVSMEVESFSRREAWLGAE